MRTFLSQIQLTIHIEVVDLLQWHPLLSTFLFSLVIVRTALAIGSLLLNDELLTGVGVDLVHLRQLLLLLLLELRLLLFVLLEAFLALVARQFAVRRPLGHALCLSSGARALRGNRISFYPSDSLWILVALTHVCRLDLSID